MPLSSAVFKRVAAIPHVKVIADASLAAYTRFQIGGPAALLCDTSDTEAFIKALHTVQMLGLPRIIIGGGTNLVVSDAGFDGAVLRYTGSRITRDGLLARIESGAILQDVVDYSINHGLKGLETMTGIPGYLGGAVYGNAGAYGRSIDELVKQVCITDGESVSTVRIEQCRFRYRDSVFKDRKEWIILSVDLQFSEGHPEGLAKTAAEIRSIRDVKYPPAMRCAGSIFKNVFLAGLPLRVQAQVPRNLVRDGKVPSAWFLEQTGAKGIRRGDVQVASYHANLIYNDGSGTAADLVSVIEELKQRVRDRFGFDLEEEVQYVGFEYADAPL
jgi:UDP-N-acetylmuramate dehydrogenase